MGFSGSDIQVVVREALMEPIRNLDIATHFKPVRALNLVLDADGLGGRG
jgi:SpoVK/Ycf46/Vps4 family AAA+-type ATPase